MLKATKLRTLQRIADGVCTICAIPLEGDVYGSTTNRKMRTCRKCRKREADDQKQLRKKRKEKGFCVRCGKRKARKYAQTCGKCRKECTLRAKRRREKTFFDKRAHNGGSRYSVLLAKTLWSIWKEQRGRCALTGIRLTRENCQLDHKIPVSKGGTNERSNLRWLQKDVNQAKSALSDEEFLTLCKAVVLYAESRWDYLNK